MPKFAPTGAVAVETLDLPIGDKVYSIQPPDAATGLVVSNIGTLLIAAANGDKPDQRAVDLVLSDDDEADLMARLLGPALDEMKADKVPYPYLQLVTMTAITWVLFGDGPAEQVWAGGAAPKVPADRRPRSTRRTR